MDFKKGALGSAIAAMGGAQVASVAAQDIAASGNGGTGDAAANGGAIAIGDINSGGNSGGAISAGDIGDGALAIDGGDVMGGLELSISADAGTAITDASGGDTNFAFVS